MDLKIEHLINIVLAENETVLKSVSESDLLTLSKELMKADQVICFGAGRMGLSLRAFSMRLNHLGIRSGFIGDTYNPPVTKDTIFLTVSGSGKTLSVLNYATLAKNKGAKIFSIVGDLNSPLADISDYPIWFNSCNGGLHSRDSADKIDSIQPMSTLNEQAMYLLLDIVALVIINDSKQQPEDFIPRHFNVE